MKVLGLVLAAIVVASLSVVVAGAAGLRVGSAGVRQTWTVDHVPPPPPVGEPAVGGDGPSVPPATGTVDPGWAPTVGAKGATP